MRLRAASMPLAIIGLTAACQPQPTPLTSCSTSAHQSLVGKNIGDVSLPESLPQRVIIPDSVIRQDMNPRRLNIHVDDKGWITRISCG
ncbi:I78 family peptidase inhibitor [Paracoccus sp. Z330]|uniref:I78 family peptidase inhibitor n=1 Tax=Paracoccus onchidii TaxID=3017813 RepID=A0ABT4ZDS7_9RHOB|nr:I78 family peptidase inhibitor [Paracoccus onchidii]MDB6177486.1 I78 family peptidase inhibitor [Paracoccus onchidii]